MTENKVLMKMARTSLADKWGLAVVTLMIPTLAGFMLQIVLKSNYGSISSILISGPFALGAALFSLAISRNQHAEFKQIFEGFNQFFKGLLAYLLITLFVLLWGLLLIVPGVIAAISYAMSYYILIDDESIGVIDAMKKSKKMMYGYKWKFFCLMLRFLGWGVLCIFTFGIGFLILIPYGYITTAKFYDDIKANAETQDDTAQVLT